MGLLGEHYTAYDLAQCLMNLQRQQKEHAHSVFAKQFKGDGIPAGECKGDISDLKEANNR